MKESPFDRPELADNVDRQRNEAWKKVQVKRFAAAFPTEEARIAYLTQRIERCVR